MTPLPKPSKNKRSPFYLGNFNRRDSRRIFRILSRIVAGLGTFSGLQQLEATILGSAQTGTGHTHCHKAKEFARKLSELGYAIFTGGSSCIMKAAHLGPAKADGLSTGLNIDLPHEQSINPYVNLTLGFRYFPSGRIRCMKYSMAFICFPGGLGSLDKLFEPLLLFRPGKEK